MDSRFGLRTRIAGAAALTAVVAGWLAFDQATGDGGRPVAWRDLTASLGPLELTREHTQVFCSRGELETSLRTTLPERGPAPPRIDFTRRRAVLVAAGPRSSTGYDLQVLRVTKHRRRIVVVIRERTPSLGDPVRARLTYPYRLITLPAGDKPLEIDWQGRP